MFTKRFRGYSIVSLKITDFRIGITLTPLGRRGGRIRQCFSLTRMFYIGPMPRDEYSRRRLPRTFASETTRAIGAVSLLLKVYYKGRIEGVSALGCITPVLVYALSCRSSRAVKMIIIIMFR